MAVYVVRLKNYENTLSTDSSVGTEFCLYFGEKYKAKDTIFSTFSPLLSL